MHKFSLEEKLLKKLKKISKKDREFYDCVMIKVYEIVNSNNLNHYKNLRKPMQRFKRVHMAKSFVLIFKYLENEDKLIFFDIGHHDNICRRNL